MTFGQIRLYRREWGAARKALRARGIAPALADAERHAIHVKVLGSDKSSLELSNRELDLVLGAFRAISSPADLDPQLDEQNQPVKRMRWVIAELCRELGAAEDYAEQVAHMMHRERGLSSGELDELGTKELVKIITALRKQVKREKKGTTKGAKSPGRTGGGKAKTTEGTEGTEGNRCISDFDLAASQTDDPF